MVVGPWSPKAIVFSASSKSAEYPLQLSVPDTLPVSLLKVICGFFSGKRPSKAIRGPEIYSSSQVVPYNFSSLDVVPSQDAAKSTAEKSRMIEVFILQQLMVNVHVKY